MIVAQKIYRTLTHKKKLNVRSYSQEKNPLSRTWDIISKEIPVFFGLNKKPAIYPEHADVVIIGGGFIGSAIAYCLKTRAGKGLSVVVLEKDLTYKEAQTNVLLGTLTQHFTLPENVYLSKYSAEFLRNIKENLNENVDIQYYPTGYLVLACEKYAEKLEENVTLQKEYGLKSELLTVQDINSKYPWINTKDIKLGSICAESGGSFNSWALLKGFVEKAQELGTIYINGEVTGFNIEKQRDVLMEGVTPGTYKRIEKIDYKTPDNEKHSIKFAACILAAGDKSGQIAKLAQIGEAEGLLSVPLPIEERKYNIYAIEDEYNKMGLATPFLMDTSGLWLRRNGFENDFLCGHIPLLSVDSKDLLDDDYYRNIIKPSLINRLPDFKNAKVHNISTEKHDCNVYDDSGVLGPHPYYNNLYIAAGFGKQGCQHAPGIGRAIAELIIDSNFTTIDLTRLGFDRLLTDEPVIEFNMY